MKIDSRLKRIKSGTEVGRTSFFGSSPTIGQDRGIVVYLNDGSHVEV